MHVCMGKSLRSDENNDRFLYSLFQNHLASLCLFHRAVSQLTRQMINVGLSAHVYVCMGESLRSRENNDRFLYSLFQNQLDSLCLVHRAVSLLTSQMINVGASAHA